MDKTGMKKHCISEIKKMEKTKGPLLDIFYILLKENGKSYVQYRTALFAANRQQLNLFKRPL